MGLQWDPATGETNEIPAPRFEDGGAEQFWKPVFDGVRSIVRRRGWSERTILLGLGGRAEAKVLPLPTLLRLDRAGWSRPGQERLNYAQSWAFVHFLLSSRAGKKLLKDYFQALRRGRDLKEAYQEVFGKVDMPALDARWRAYVDQLK